MDLENLRRLKQLKDSYILQYDTTASAYDRLLAKSIMISVTLGQREDVTMEEFLRGQEEKAALVPLRKSALRKINHLWPRLVRLNRILSS